ncbi:GNAT family N-acetyltransferase [Methylotenera sp. 1P/1]|uniref:GNAT family N-acetyltransferase n=1 Tax=Methylotenera sp. 1P/1 TaxID=1131551 RepID=UPI00037D1867|nr:GNAT family N-acetyltransferase [Methylotenera sp. 1P/1]
MQLPSSYTAKTIASMQDIDALAWNALTDGTPFLQHAFLLALEQSKSVGEGTGWSTCAITLLDQQAQLIGAIPAYLKTHSYGEYVFDWSWAEAYVQHQIPYYPKLVCAVPFTPVTCSKLLSHDPVVSQLLVAALTNLLDQHQLSSAHALFPSETCSPFFQEAGWLKRDGVQFRWQNKAYPNWEAFLATLSHDKRKKIRQERKKVVEAGVQCKWLMGTDISESDWDFFYDCYCNTYRAHHSSPYLTREFFSLIGQSMPSNILMIVAELYGKPIAATLNIYNANTLYGRYWGALHYVSNLHFELCYYQAQAFCIAQGITYFEGGAQGEHKLARGFEPRPTCSYHQIAHPDFKAAISRFLQKESSHMSAYTSELEERAPFKKTLLE